MRRGNKQTLHQHSVADGAAFRLAVVPAGSARCCATHISRRGNDSSTKHRLPTAHTPPPLLLARAPALPPLLPPRLTACTAYCASADISRANNTRGRRHLPPRRRTLSPLLYCHMYSSTALYRHVNRAPRTVCYRRKRHRMTSSGGHDAQLFAGGDACHCLALRRRDHGKLSRRRFSDVGIPNWTEVCDV